MHIINVPNVNDALRVGIAYMKNEGTLDKSRNGDVLAAPGPVVTVYNHPCQRVLFNPVRDANPYFHLMESLWMLAGRNDVEFVKYYASRMGEFSDDGTILHGAYGFRWRAAVGFDQLPVIIEELKENPKSRRCVLQMWDSSDSYSEGTSDLLRAVRLGKDVPCNTHAYFDTVGGKLNMTVCCRSNDVIWGAYGANAVHFSFLLEYVARSASLPIGEYRQFSNNYHIYVDRPDVVKLLQADEIYYKAFQSQRDIYQDHYAMPNYSTAPPTAAVFPLMQNGEQGRFDADLAMFFRLWRASPTNHIQAPHFHEPFFAQVVVPLHEAYQRYKREDLHGAMRAAAQIEATDWKLACTQWLERRIAKREGK
jgi:thymidylate synthase